MYGLGKNGESGRVACLMDEGKGLFKAAANALSREVAHRY